jgi:hypothetical protein
MVKNKRIRAAITTFVNMVTIDSLLEAYLVESYFM